MKNKDKESLNRLQFLDSCTDGNIDKFNHLINPDYDKMDMAFRYCELLIRKLVMKPSDIETITYDFENNASVFNVFLKPDRYEDISNHKRMKCPTGVTLDPSTKSILINISVI